VRRRPVRLRLADRGGGVGAHRFTARGRGRGAVLASGGLGRGASGRGELLIYGHARWSTSFEGCISSVGCETNWVPSLCW
jgi:hypothetical protein